MAEQDLVPPINTPLIDVQTGRLTLAWQAFFTLLASKIKALETP